MKIVTLKTLIPKMILVMIIQISVVFVFDLNIIPGSFYPYLRVNSNFIFYFDLIYLVFNLPFFYIVGTTLTDTITKMPLIGCGGSIKIIQLFLIRFFVLFLGQLIISLLLFLKLYSGQNLLLIQISLLPFYFLLNLIAGFVKGNEIYLYITIVTGVCLILSKLNITSFLPGVSQYNVLISVLVSIGLVGAAFYKIITSDYLKGDKV